jgi:Concanavalin A-like lectin/glucanases superfamily/VanZ like family
MGGRIYALRPAHLILAAAILLVLGATLLPSEPAGPVEWGQVLCVLCSRAALADGLANLALFLPLGVALALVGCPPRRALLFAATLSLSVELAQFAIPGRDPSLSDFLFNTVGAALGGAIVRLARQQAWPGVRTASRLSLLAAFTAAAVFALTDALLATSLPNTAYFGGSAYMQSSDKPLRLGGNIEPHGYFQGRLDEVRIYRRARTPSEIQADMNTPVAAAARPPDLAAAYDFDEGAGSVLNDISGHGNTGQIRGATWTSQGKFGGALAFDGVDNVVVIPHSPSLDLTSAMTLEAWIYPTAAQRGWRAILQKEFDTYFLLASSRAGALKPGGGGTFGSSTETLATLAVVPTNSWTHVAVVYDGAVLQLYINGRLTMRRIRWYPGRVLTAAVDGLTIPAGISAESWQLRTQLLSGAPVRIRAVAAAPVPTETPLVTLHDAVRNELLLVATEGDDVLFRLRTRAAAAELDSPALRARGIMRGLGPGDILAMTVSRAGRTYCVGVNERSMCGLGFTLGMGWSFFAYSQVAAGWPHTALNAVWMAALLFPFGFWLRPRRESLLGALVLAAGAMLPCTLGNLSASTPEIGAAAVGILAGWTAARWTAGTKPQSEAGPGAHQ